MFYPCCKDYQSHKQYDENNKIVIKKIKLHNMDIFVTSKLWENNQGLYGKVAFYLMTNGNHQILRKPRLAH